MNPPLKRLSIAGLRWTLGLVVLCESVRFVFSPSTIHHLAKAGFPQWIRQALGGSEIIAVLLFLVPPVSLVGGYLLLFVFAIAVILHLLHGEFDVGGLIVYAMAVIVCITRRNDKTTEVPHD